MAVDPLSLPARKRRTWPIPVMLFGAALMVVLWQGWLYFDQQHDYDQYRFNMTERILVLGKTLQVTNDTNNEKMSEASNAIERLLIRLTALETTVFKLSRTLSSGRDESSKSMMEIIEHLNGLNSSVQQYRTEGKNFLLELDARLLNLDKSLITGSDENVRSIMAITEQLKALNQTVREYQNGQRSNSQTGISTQSLAMSKNDIHAVKNFPAVDQLSSQMLESRFNRTLEKSTFYPLKDVTKFGHGGNDGIHGIFSDILGRGMAIGSPEFFIFPSDFSKYRLLCLRGNHSFDGTQNSYAYVMPHAVPNDAILVNGTTLVADTYWDYHNPWHSMYNLIQFVYWRMEARIGGKSGACRESEHMVLYHWGELRTDMGSWIASILNASGVTTEFQLLGNYNDKPMCFKEAVLSRSGIGGVPTEMLQGLYEEIRCNARRVCGIPVSRTGPSPEPKVRVTIFARTGGREFKNLTEWEVVVSKVCSKFQGCEWRSTHVAGLTFCQQVEVMTATDILVTVHGAQLTNIIFMSPGSRILEIFPKGWLEMAGQGQYIYSHLAKWAGLMHEGYWRDPFTPDCPGSNDCFTWYKNQKLSINTTHVTDWLSNSIQNFMLMQADQMLSKDKRHDPNFHLFWDKPDCLCGEPLKV